MRQLVLDLAGPAPHTFASFRPGRNAEALALLHELAARPAGGRVVYLWGAEGSGKTHLLHAAVSMVAASGMRGEYIDFRGAAPDGRAEFSDAPVAPSDAIAAASGALAAPPDSRGSRIEPPLPPSVLLALDHVDQAGAEAQAAAFTLFNRTREAGGSVIAAGGCPVSRLPLREDLRTRLGWGPSLEVFALSDEEKCDALLDAAAHRGIGLPPEVAGYLLRHGPRDLASLLAILAAADRLSLAERRPLTVPLLRVFLHDEGGAGPRQR